MGYKYIHSVLNISKAIMDSVIDKDDYVIDATVGNGKDTLYMAKLVGNRGKVYGFDIQKIAIERTKEKLINEGLYRQVELINTGHEHMDMYINEKVKLIVFNLGYLPGGNKNIITKPDTTIQAIKKSLNLLMDNGILLITSYIGHIGGIEEKNAVEEFLQKLDQKEYNVLQFKFINQINNPPILYGVEKRLNKEG